MNYLTVLSNSEYVMYMYACSKHDVGVQRTDLYREIICLYMDKTKTELDKIPL